MERDFWLERWENNQIGFHQDDFSPYLSEHWSSLTKSANCQVFVPMAGKTKDMLWLANEGHTVLGIELSEIAVDAFFAENDLTASKETIGPYVHHTSENIQFICGDFFHLTPEQTNEIKLVFDRASMVAMPVDLRNKYADHMALLLSPGVETLMVSMEYPEGEMSGPPFSVSEADVNALFSKNFEIKLLASIDVLEQNPNLSKRGITAMDEKVYQLTRR